MPVSEDKYAKATQDSLKVLREYARRDKKIKTRTCVNCIYWEDKDLTSGICRCNLIFADYTDLRTWYHETCCYFFRDIK